MEDRFLIVIYFISWNKSIIRIKELSRFTKVDGNTTDLWRGLLISRTRHTVQKGQNLRTITDVTNDLCVCSVILYKIQIPIRRMGSSYDTLMN